jgi:hypothetical protein
MRRPLVATLALATSCVALASQGERLDSSSFEWPVAKDLAQYGIHLRMPYQKARQRMIQQGWSPDPTEANERHKTGHLPYPNFPEVLCGEGYDAICSGWFSKGSEQRVLDVRDVRKVLLVRGSGQ